MKVLLFAILALTAVSAVQAACGCMKCSKNLFVATPPTAQVQVIYRGAGPDSLPSTRSRLIPYTVEKPIIRTTTKPVVLRDHTYTLAPVKVVKKEVYETPESYYGYQVEVPVQKASSCPKCYVGLVAQTDRVVLPAPSYREIENENVKGPVFEPLTTMDVDEEESIYEPYPYNRCPCSRYALSVRSLFARRFNKDVDHCTGNLTEQQIEDNIEQNIRDIFFDDSPLGRLKRYFSFTLPKMVQSPFKVNHTNPPLFAFRGKRSLLPILGGSACQQQHSKMPKKRSVNPVDESLEPSNEETPRATELFLENLNWEQVIPRVPLLFFVSAPVRLMARFHSLNKHLEPVVQSVPTVVRTSGRYMENCGNKFRDGFLDFLRLLMNVFSGRRKRALTEHNQYELIPCRVYPNNTADFAIVNPCATRNAFVLVVVTGVSDKAAQMKFYLMNSNAKPRRRKKRGLFEMDQYGDMPELLQGKWGLFSDSTHHDRKPLESAEVIFQDHLKQVPKLYDAFKEIRERRTSARFPPLPYHQREPVLGTSYQERPPNGDFAHLHPEKNLMVIKKELSNVLSILHKLISTDIEQEVKIYEMLLKLQYLKSTLVVDWRKNLQSPRANSATAKMNILDYIEEIDRFGESVNKRLLIYMHSHLDSYNRHECVNLLAQLYKLQLIFQRIAEDLNERIKMAGKFSLTSELNFIEQLDKLCFVDKTNMSDLQQQLKELRDGRVKKILDFLDKLRYLAEFQAGNETADNEHREKVNEFARMIQENAHYKTQQLKVIRELMQKAKANRDSRKELKHLWDLERHIAENEEILMMKSDQDTNVMMKEPAGSAVEESKKKGGNGLKGRNLGDLLKLPAPKPDLKLSFVSANSVKKKLTEFEKKAKQIEEAWAKGAKKLAEIMKEGTC